MPLCFTWAQTLNKNTQLSAHLTHAREGAHTPPLTLAHAHFSACYRFHLPHAHGFDAKQGIRLYLVLFR